MYFPLALKPIHFMTQFIERCVSIFSYTLTLIRIHFDLNVKMSSIMKLVFIQEQEKEGQSQNCTVKGLLCSYDSRVRIVEMYGDSQNYNEFTINT